MKTKQTIALLAAAGLCVCPAAMVAETTLVLKSHVIKNATAALEPEVLDFRYQPERWQTCIGLPDDPFKTIVGSDGGLYYDYGKAGPASYTLGGGRFGTRLLAELDAEGEPTPKSQQLHSPRVPEVEEIMGRLRKALELLKPEQLWVNPDCGLKTRGWPEVQASLRNMVEAAKSVRRIVGGK